MQTSTVTVMANYLMILSGVGWRARPPALAGHSCGCFLPDLTRFTTMQCEEARHKTVTYFLYLTIDKITLLQ